MKSSIRFFVGISLLVLFVFCYSCGVENSESEMKEAQQAMEKAKSLFAEDLAASDWKEAMEVWQQGQDAVKEGKPSKTLFLRAKSRFEKTASIAKSTGGTLSREVAEMQIAIGERFAKLKSNFQSGRASSKLQTQLKPIVAEIDEGTTSLDSLMTKGSYLKAKMMAKDLSTKLYRAELILQGKKPKF